MRFNLLYGSQNLGTACVTPVWLGQASKISFNQVQEELYWMKSLAKELCLRFRVDISHGCTQSTLDSVKHTRKARTFLSPACPTLKAILLQASFWQLAEAAMP